MIKPQKIMVALSGGVDSAVAAALLKKQGHEVVGVFFLFFGSRVSNSSAKKIAKKLRIPLKIVDARREFRKRIVNRFIELLKKGETPNPCVVCNKEMKFRLLFDWMEKNKFDAVATGHYARLVQAPGSSRMPKAQNIRLLEARDKTKDQSYFLYRLTQKEFSKIIFPLGSYEKSEVKMIAKKLKIPALKEESQDICFLAGKTIDKFLKKRVKSEKGKIIDMSGNCLGRHQGLPLYTIGQRKGIEVGGAGPYFVVGKNSRKNELVVTNDQKRLFAQKFTINRANWINPSSKFPLSAQVQIRYHAEKIPAIIRKEKNGKYAVRVRFALRAVTPGQSAVFYKNGKVLGGGTII